MCFIRSFFLSTTCPAVSILYFHDHRNIVHQMLAHTDALSRTHTHTHLHRLHTEQHNKMTVYLIGMRVVLYTGYTWCTLIVELWTLAIMWLFWNGIMPLLSFAISAIACYSVSTSLSLSAFRLLLLFQKLIKLKWWKTINERAGEKVF